MSPAPNNSSLKRLRVALLSFVALGLIFALLFLSTGPAHLGTRPTPPDVEAAREVWHQLRAPQLAGEPTIIRVDNRMIVGLATLASDATDVASFQGSITRGVLFAQASISLPAGLWINVSTAASGQHSGFPEPRLRVGRVTFPRTATRWLASGVRWILELNGAQIPPLNEMVRHVRIDQREVAIHLALPQDSGVVDRVIAASGTSVDHELISAIYCRVSAAQKSEPATDLASVIRRAFVKAPRASNQEYSRAAFVALAFLVVGEEAERLAPQAARSTKNCPSPPPILLQQRHDLAKHWALSAALAAVLGEHAATSLGEWKELNDSLSEGSGFSFVDLAADRAGLRTALLTLAPDSAADTIDQLSRATEEDLLPAALLKAPEGLSESAFKDRFGGIDQERYRQVVASIDEMLIAKSR